MLQFVIASLFTAQSIFAELNVRGIDPANLHLYQKNELFCPGNPTKKLTIEMINDDFCDCPEDGFDEPGTSACNKGVFFCKNAGFLPRSLGSIFVNDGVCDCCDGSDEYLNDGIKCPNTCAELKKEHDKAEAERTALLQKGQEAKAGLIKKAAEMRKVHKKQLEIGRLEIQALENQLQVLKNFVNDSKKKDKIVEPENYENHCAELQDKYEKVRDIFETMRDASDTCKAKAEALVNFDHLEGRRPSQHNKDAHIIFDEFIKDPEVDDPNKKGLWEYLKQLEFADFRNFFRQHRVTKTVTVVVTSTPTAVNQEERADPVKEMEEKINNSKVKLAELEKKYEKDYGSEDVFLPLQDQCIDIKHDKYIYKLCFFSKVVQTEARAGIYNHDTDLGKWKSWEETKDGKPDFSKMIYDGGLHCWNGPQRSTEVLLECGPENAIIEVSEPSTCSYVMRVKSPAVC